MSAYHAQVSPRATVRARVREEAALVLEAQAEREHDHRLPHDRQVMQRVVEPERKTRRSAAGCRSRPNPASASRCLGAKAAASLPICVRPRDSRCRRSKRPRTISNAYLSQLEQGKVQKPSPNRLHSLAEVYAVPYESLMEKAGYLLPSGSGGGGRRRRLAAFAIDDLTAEEEEELLKHLAFIRSREPTPGVRRGRRLPRNWAPLQCPVRRGAEDPATSGVPQSLRDPCCGLLRHLAKTLVRIDGCGHYAVGTRPESWCIFRDFLRVSRGLVDAA